MRTFFFEETRNGGHTRRERSAAKGWLLWILKAYLFSMATQTMSSNGGSITCSSCQMTVVQSPGTRRTICPHCGNFYDPAHAASLSQRRQDRPKPQEDPRYPQVGN